MARVMLSTADNPFNPFTQYEQWAGYDKLQHIKNSCNYNSQTLLARFAPVCPEETKEDAERITEDACDEIIEKNFPIFNPMTGKESFYIKVYAPSRRRKN